jgi:hypothetical protein
MSYESDEEGINEELLKELEKKKIFNYTIGFIVLVRDINIYRDLLTLLRHYEGATLVTSRISTKKLYISAKAPEGKEEE